MRSIVRDKLSTLIDFPIDGLDLTRFNCSPQCVDGDGRPLKPVYDLYAVVNHTGNPFGGHYTAYARSFSEDLGEFFYWKIPFSLIHLFKTDWRRFDDEYVEKEEDPRRVVSPAAYLLFYKLRDF